MDTKIYIVLFLFIILSILSFGIGVINHDEIKKLKNIMKKRDSKVVYQILPKDKNYKGFALIVAENREEAIQLFKEENPFNEILYKEAHCECSLVKGLTYGGKDIIILNNIKYIKY